MSINASINKPAYVIFEDLVNGRVSGLVIKDNEDWLVETEDGETGGFLEMPRNFQMPAMISFFGKGMGGVDRVLNLLKAHDPSITWSLT